MSTDQPALVTAVRALENASALDAAARVGDRISIALVTDPARRAALQGAAIGHALHPLLVELPIGTWTSAAALDLLGGRSSRTSATLLTALGIAGAVPAAVTGWAEYEHAGPRGRRVAVVHAGANAAGVGLQLASLRARLRGRHRTGAALGLVALGVTGAAGYLGGHLAVARGIGSHDPAFGPEPDSARA